MFRRFVRLLSDTWILDLAAGAALGLAFLDFVRSIFSMIIQFWTQKEPEGDPSVLDIFQGGFGSLEFTVDGRPVYLALIVESGLTLLVIAAVVILVVRALPAVEDVESHSG
jgi:large-conductance mechanosensitive channel